MKDPLKSQRRLVFVSGHDPENPRAFSGSVFYIHKALLGRFPEMETIRFARPRGYERFKKVVMILSKKRLDPDYWRLLNRAFAWRLARRWRGDSVLVISVVSAALVSELAEWLPVVNVTDATFELMRNFPENFLTYSNTTAMAAEKIERRSIVLSAHNSFSTNWAAASAIQHYGANADRVSAISWGCNLPPVPQSEVRQRSATWKECRLIFIGTDWLRKGGDVVCEVCQILSDKGIPVRVDFVGSSPPSGLQPRSWLNFHGFLNKSDPIQHLRLVEMMRNADFLFLPTRQDTFGMVFGEANAYGTPGLTRAVGGVGETVCSGRNGIVLRKDAQPNEFAAEIERLWKDPERYWLLRRTSRNEYEGRLNWSIWSQTMSKIIDELLNE